MKKMFAVGFCMAVAAVLFSQDAVAGTSFSMSIGTPGMYVDMSSVRPSPHHVWVDGCRQWNGRSHVWVPGHWRYTPRERTVYVPVRHGFDRHYGHHGYGNGMREDRQERRHGMRNDRPQGRCDDRPGDRDDVRWRESSRWN